MPHRALTSAVIILVLVAGAFLLRSGSQRPVLSGKVTPTPTEAPRSVRTQKDDWSSFPRNAEDAKRRAQRMLEEEATLPMLNKPFVPNSIRDDAANDTPSFVFRPPEALPRRTRASASASPSLPGVNDEFLDTLGKTFGDQDDRAGEKPESHLLAGVVSHVDKAIASSGSLPSLFASPSPSPLPRVGGQSRGVAALYLMHPNARPAVDEQIRILRQAEIQDVYLGVLADGTFGIDFDYLNSVIRLLNEDGRVLTLELYLSSGPTMREYATTAVTGGFSRIHPTDFRGLIRYDPEIQAQFRSIVRATIPSFELNRSFGVRNRNFASVMLEDNLDRDSYAAMRGIAYEILGERVVMIRNPCPGCWPGNDIFSFGDPLEVHAVSEMSLLQPGGGFTLDGLGYRFPWEDDRTQLSIDQVKEAFSQAQARGLAFVGLWRKQRQGVERGKIDPDLRNYEIPTPEQGAVEIEVLRYGLVEVK